MRVLIACEFSGTVREAFRRKGHDATSCDLRETLFPGQHYRGDVRDILGRNWDLVIAHPPCTFLASSGARWFKDRQEQQQEAVRFFRLFTELNAPKVCIENPVGVMSTLYRKPDQIIQPYWFGENASKKTCLWLKGLPLLRPTEEFAPVYGCKCGCRFISSRGKYACPSCCGENGPAKLIWGNQTPSGQNALGPSPDRELRRSMTFQGIAEAMADQWTEEEDER